MKYHYQTGVRKSVWERVVKIFWISIVIFLTVFVYDILFNNCNLFIKLIIWTWE